MAENESPTGVVPNTGVIPIDFTGVPDQDPILMTGIYLLQIEQTRIADNKAGSGKNVEVDFTFKTVEGEDRSRTEYIGFSNKTRLKRLALSAGIQPGPTGLDIAQLAGRRVVAMVKGGTYIDKETSLARPSVSVQEYFLPSDPQYSMAVNAAVMVG